MTDPPDRIEIRRGRPADFLPIVRLFEGALLEIDPEAIRGRLDQEPVEAIFVATIERNGTDSAGPPSESTPIGAIWLDTSEPPVSVEAIAVAPRYRRRGIGRTLCERAADEHGSLVARFDERVRPFYDALGWSIEPEGDRLLGRYS